MKKFPMFFAALAAALPVFTSCEENGGPEATYDISISLKYEGSAYGAEGITVALSVLNGGASYEAATNASGTASFCVPAGTYEASASFRTAENGNVLTFNGVNSSVVVTATMSPSARSSNVMTVKAPSDTVWYSTPSSKVTVSDSPALVKVMSVVSV